LSFRQKLLLLFAATILLCVAVMSISVYSSMRKSFEFANQDRAASVAAQFRAEFERRGQVVEHKVEAVAATEAVQHMALELNRSAAATASASESTSDPAAARALASQQQLDFLELVDNQGRILSSAQWPAKFGYPEPLLAPSADPVAESGQGVVPQGPTGNAREPLSRANLGPFLKIEELPNGPTLGLFAIRVVQVGDQTVSVIGGQRLDQQFLSTLDIPAGTRVLLYQNLSPKWNPQSLLDLNGPAAGADRVEALIEKARSTGREAQAPIYWTSDSADAEVIHAIPLTGQNQRVMGVLLVGSSRRPLIELQRRVISTAMFVGTLGILVALLTSLWFADRVTRPVVSLADAARRVAAGDLSTKVDVESHDELGELAASFNRMTEDLVQQKERAVQAERVAAWRELARRLAHELKNPLFPLQVTVENLMRAKTKSPEMFEEVFDEGTATLLAEINNLKTIIGRFSEFSKMPQPERRPTQVNDSLQSVLRVFQAQLQGQGQSLSQEHIDAQPLADTQAQPKLKTGIAVRTELAANLPEISADPDLLHRALSNLVLNAIDAMPQGGELMLRTALVKGVAFGESNNRVAISISDTGTGLTPEECARLFTPYYTTKQHGTGLGLAIVQSVVTDHGGKISVESTKEEGTTFRIELPV
jgi:two-component system, NtrC family, nitrogen regulation sensor histidine kinase NtrY